MISFNFTFQIALDEGSNYFSRFLKRMERNLEVCDSTISRKLVRNTLEKHGIFIFRSFSDLDATLQLEEKRRNDEMWKNVPS